MLPSLMSPVGQCANCGRPARAGVLCCCCGALLHPACLSLSCSDGPARCDRCSLLGECNRASPEAEISFSAEVTFVSDLESEDRLYDTILEAEEDQSLSPQSRRGSIDSEDNASRLDLSELVSLLEQQLVVARDSIARLEGLVESKLCPRCGQRTYPTEEGKVSKAEQTDEFHSEGEDGYGKGDKCLSESKVTIRVTDFDQSPRTGTPEDTHGGEMLTSLHCVAALRQRVVEVVADDNGVSLTVELLSTMTGIMTGMVRPGAGLDQLLPDLVRALSQRQANDVIVFLGGTNDIHPSLDVQQFVQHLVRSVTSVQFEASLIICEVFHRYDIGPVSGQITGDVNSEVQKRLSKEAEILSTSLFTRPDYTRRGCHLNRFGKRKLARVVKSAVLSMLSRC